MDGGIPRSASLERDSKSIGDDAEGASGLQAFARSRSCSRSTFPLRLRGISSTVVKIVGTSHGGNLLINADRSSSTSLVVTTKAASRVTSSSVQVTTPASLTSGMAAIAISTSPGSTRCPATLT